ncbi:unnamed protein product [Camellia sinensis]
MNVPLQSSIETYLARMFCCNRKYKAHISDFGTARFTKADSSNWTSFAGTFGYTAPELAYTMEVNDIFLSKSFIPFTE